ncbi:hypothetical protein L7F22_050087, partial [Adiantum nelumboides]|nr:hypothetical protein [Adiantum nelumboides]
MSLRALHKKISRQPEMQEIRQAAKSIKLFEGLQSATHQDKVHNMQKIDCKEAMATKGNYDQGCNKKAHSSRSKESRIRAHQGLMAALGGLLRCKKAAL